MCNKTSSNFSYQDSTAISSISSCSLNNAASDWTISSSSIDTNIKISDQCNITIQPSNLNIVTDNWHWPADNYDSGNWYPKYSTNFYVNDLSKITVKVVDDIYNLPRSFCYDSGVIVYAKKQEQLYVWYSEGIKFVKYLDYINGRYDKTDDKIEVEEHNLLLYFL